MATASFQTLRIARDTPTIPCFNVKHFVAVAPVLLPLNIRLLMKMPVFRKYQARVDYEFQKERLSHKLEVLAFPYPYRSLNPVHFALSLNRILSTQHYHYR